MRVFQGIGQGTGVRDRTSGFRLYRAEVVRRIELRCAGFAFLPEILVDAQRMGLKVEEAPIHFVFRRQGRSKMAFWPTSLSYLTFFRSQVDTRTWAVLALLLAGLALRLVLTFPAHKYIADADSLLTGMNAFQVLRGETPVFFSGVRIGSIGSHVAAALFLCMGPSRTSLALVPVLFGFALLVLSYGLYRELFPPGVALTALLFLALPSPAFISWTYMPNSYDVTLFLCGAILWSAALLERRGPSRARVALFGLIAGLGWWQSFLTLGALGAALAWLLWRRRGRRPRLWALGLICFTLGAFPWIAFNIVWPLRTFRNNYAARPAHGIAAIASNVHYLLTYSLPEVVTPVREAWTTLLDDAAGGLHNRLLWPVRLVFAAAALLFLAVPVLRGRAGGEVRRRFGSSPWLLFALVIAAYAVLNVFSEAGQARGVSVRYVLPLYLLVPGMLALLLSLVAARSRALAVLLASVVVLFNATAYHFPGRASREAWREAAERDDRMIALLRRRGIDGIVGGYWMAYPVNFLSREKILAVPCGFDYYNYRGHRPPGRLYHWALVSARPQELAAWAAKTGLSGSLVLAAPDRAVFLLANNPSAPAAQEQLLDRLQASCTLMD